MTLVNCSCGTGWVNVTLETGEAAVDLAVMVAIPGMFQHWRDGHETTAPAPLAPFIRRHAATFAAARPPEVEYIPPGKAQRG